MTSQFKHLPKGSHEAFAHTTRFLADVLRRGEAMTTKEIWEAGVTRGWAANGVVGSGGELKMGELEYPVSISKTDLKQRIMPSLRAQGIIRREHISTPAGSAKIDPLSRGLRLASRSSGKGTEGNSSNATQGESSGSNGKRVASGSSAPAQVSEWVWTLLPNLQTDPEAGITSRRGAVPRTRESTTLIEEFFPALTSMSEPSDPSGSSPMTIADLATMQRALSEQREQNQASAELRKQRGGQGIRSLKEELDAMGLSKRRRRARLGKEIRMEKQVIAFKKLVGSAGRAGGGEAQTT